MQGDAVLSQLNGIDADLNSADAAIEAQQILQEVAAKIQQALQKIGEALDSELVSISEQLDGLEALDATGAFAQEIADGRSAVAEKDTAAGRAAVAAARTKYANAQS